MSNQQRHYFVCVLFPHTKLFDIIPACALCSICICNMYPTMLTSNSAVSSIWTNWSTVLVSWTYVGTDSMNPCGLSMLFQNEIRKHRYLHCIQSKWNEYEYTFHLFVIQCEYGIFFSNFSYFLCEWNYISVAGNLDMCCLVENVHNFYCCL